MDNEQLLDTTLDDVVGLADEYAPATVTEEDVLIAFANAEKTLGYNQVIAESLIAEEPATQNGDTDDALIDREEHIKQFHMDFSVDDMFDVENTEEAVVADDDVPLVENDPLQPTEPTAIVDVPPAEENHTVPSKSNGCLARLIFVLLVLLISVTLATVITTAVFDITGFNRNNRKADVFIPKGADTEQVASILKKEGMINSEFYFRMYVRFMNLDGKWQSGSFPLQADMGFPNLIKTMQALPPRETVKVTFPEGLTVLEMAAILEENNVCKADDFISAVRYGDYDYDFIRDIPTEADDPAYANRAYRLEGYLFPDTYEFFVGSQAETVVNRMLQNFETRITPQMLAQIQESGWTLDEAVIFASIIQGEADTIENMGKVSRVLYNRFDPSSGFKKLQLCSTRDYVNYLLTFKSEAYNQEVLKQAYNTYYREGLPIGAINNPGLDAFKAILSPSQDKATMECYYFATDYKTGITYFSKTYEEHKAICKKYDIEDIG